MMHHVGLPRYSVVAPATVPAPRSLLSTAPPSIMPPQFSAASMPMQMYLHGIAQRENMLRNAFADYLKPVCTPDGEILLDVECGENHGMLYLSRFCQGSKGPCIRFDDMWLTPNEFQYISGRESAKDWKRSIRHQGKSLKLLLAKGILTVHQSSCSCTGCRISSPVNRGKLANCNPRFGYESMFDFTEKPLPHLFGNFQPAHEPDADDVPLSPSNPSHSSKESSDFSSSGIQENSKFHKQADDGLYERKLGLPTASSSLHAGYSAGQISKDYLHFRQQQPPIDLGSIKPDSNIRDTYPVCKPIAQMFTGVSSSQNVEIMQSLLRGSGGVRHNIATPSSAFYPFGLSTCQQTEESSDSPRNSLANSPISPSASSVSSHTLSSPSEDEPKHIQPLDLSTARSGKAPKLTGRYMKPSNPPPSEESMSPYGNGIRDVKTPYSRPSTSAKVKKAHQDRLAGQQPSTFHQFRQSPNPAEEPLVNERSSQDLPVCLGQQGIRRSFGIPEGPVSHCSDHDCSNSDHDDMNSDTTPDV